MGYASGLDVAGPYQKAGYDLSQVFLCFGYQPGSGITPFCKSGNLDHVKNIAELFLVVSSEANIRIVSEYKLACITTSKIRIIGGDNGRSTQVHSVVLILLASIWPVLRVERLAVAAERASGGRYRFHQLMRIGGCRPEL